MRISQAAYAEAKNDQCGGHLGDLRIAICVEVAGIEPASVAGEPGLLRVQCAVEFLGPRARAHTFPDRLS